MVYADMKAAWWRPSLPEQALAHPRPWLGEQVIERLEAILQPSWTVIEHGSGGSTLWLSQRVASVISIEHDETWYRALNERRIANVQMILCADGIPELPQAHLLLIDGGANTIDRAPWLRAAPALVCAGGWVVLDNANRPEYEAERESLKTAAQFYETLDCNDGISKYLVTDFFKLPGGKET